MSDINVKISGNVHKVAAVHCNEKGLILWRYCDDAVKEKLQRDGKLPPDKQEAKQVKTHSQTNY